MKRFIYSSLVGILCATWSLVRGAAPAVESLLVENQASPIVSFRILVKTGAASDPAGKEGLASLTAAMLAKGGSRQLSYDQILKAMYPIATSFEWQVDKEMTVFIGATHLDNVEKYYDLIRQMLLEPGFREEDFMRLKTDAINFLKINLRDGNDEELAKEELYNVIFQKHPYGHHNMGRVSSLEKISIQDVKDFYKKHYHAKNIVLGLAGRPSAALRERMQKDFGNLASEMPKSVTTSRPDSPNEWTAEIIQRETRSTAISMGFPISARRGEKDWPALALVSSYLGQHRSSNSHLFQRLREARGLNYGDYSYIEYFPRGMYQFEPDPNLARQQQIFQIWIRPVPPGNDLFALRGALYELDKLIRDGLSKEAFERTREFLSKYVNILTATQDARLGYALDSKFYQIEDFDAYLPKQLAKLTLEEVNQAIRRHLSMKAIRIVMVTKDAQKLRSDLLSGKPSPISYNAPKPKEILEEDKVIEKFPLPLKPAHVKVVPVDQVFQ